MLKEILDGKKHPLLNFMTDQNTQFFIVRAPSEDFFVMALKKN
jgi:hypothetical protein